MVIYADDICFGIDVICQTIVTVHSTKVRLEQLCEEIYERHVT